jgi:ribosomal-protein-alanine N-acetyltransferase
MLTLILVCFGDKTMWFKGFATEAVSLLVDFSFQTLDLNRVQAGYFSGNTGNAKIFERNQFIIEGSRRQHNKSCGKYLDTLMVGLLREDWQLAE